MDRRYVIVYSEPGPDGNYIHEFIDTETGVHYLSAHNVGLYPRLNADGTIMTENYKKYK